MVGSGRSAFGTCQDKRYAQKKAAEIHTHETLLVRKDEGRKERKEKERRLGELRRNNGQGTRRRRRLDTEKSSDKQVAQPEAHGKQPPSQHHPATHTHTPCEPTAPRDSSSDRPTAVLARSVAEAARPRSVVSPRLRWTPRPAAVGSISVSVV